jgi:glycine cleavage system regulatory protein
MAIPKNIGKFLIVGAGGILILLLFAFFVSMLFASRSHMYPAGSVNSDKMVGSFGEISVPQMMTEKLSFEADRRADTTSGASPEYSAPHIGSEDRKTIKVGNLSLSVQSVDRALEQVGKIVAESGGNLFDSRFSQSSSGVKSGIVTVKVPVDRFSEAFDRLKEVATVVLSESTSGADVTAQYIDLQARINNKKAAEVTLQTLFERAVKISDVIEVTDKLTQVRGEIESLEGQLRYLSVQTDMASITLSLTEDVTVVADQGFRPLQTFKESAVALIRVLERLIEKTIQFLVLGLPMLLVYGLIFWVLYRLGRRLMSKIWSCRMEEGKRISRKR